MKSGNLNFLEPSGLLQACNGTDLPLPLLIKIIVFVVLTQCVDHELTQVIRLCVLFLSSRWLSYSYV